MTKEPKGCPTPGVCSALEELAASQAREAKLREGVLNTANACRIWGGEAERARKMLEHYLAITDSTQSE